MSQTRRFFLASSAVSGLSLVFPWNVVLGEESSAASKRGTGETGERKETADFADARPTDAEREEIVELVRGAEASPAKPSRYLEAVLETLDFERPELARSFEGATTPMEKQEALLKYFRTRRVVSAYELYFGRKIWEDGENRGDGEVQREGEDRGDAEVQSNGRGRLNARGLSNARTRKEADEALRHVFVGQPSYSSEFRGWKTLDWDTNPHKDREWLWQLHRFSWHLSLALEYASSGDERYAREWVFEIRSWIAHMHRPENANRHPGWRSLDTALRLRQWACVLEFFLLSPTLDSETLVDFIYSMNVHSQRIRECCERARNRTGELGNWDIFHTEGLLWGAAVFPERRASKEELQLAARLFVEFQKRVLLDDGVINEFIPSYHSAYPGQFLRLVTVARRLDLPVEIPQEYFELLEKSINAMVVWSHPDGTSPVFGDAWLGDRDGNRRWLKRFLREFDRPDWEWFASKGAAGRAPDVLIQELPTAGYHTMRSDWTEKALFIVVKNSNTTRFGHNQADNLTFELSAFGERLMTDSGCFNYSGEPEWRAYFRSPGVHQLTTLNDLPILSRGRKVGQRSFLAEGKRPAAEELILENEPVEGLIHRRTFQLIDGRFFVILDELSGAASGELRQHFQFLPGDWRLDVVQNAAWTKHPQNANLLLVGAKSPGAEISLEEEEGWISTRYMQKERRPAFAFVQTKKENEIRRFATALYPVSRGESAEPRGLTFSLDENLAWSLELNGKRWEFEF